jgi:glycosyltransferase involved in cell wall biosynthesis
MRGGLHHGTPESLAGEKTRRLDGIRNASMKPMVSVIMSTYNGSKYLEDSIDSILRQSMPDLELIVVDDGSTDGSHGILERRARRDPRILIHKRERGGLTSALNLGIKAAAGKYIARQDDDDISLPDRLQVQVGFLEENPGMGLIGCGHSIFDENGSEVSVHSAGRTHESLEKSLPDRNLFCHGTIVMQAELAKAIGGYRERFFFSQDYDLVLRALEKTRMQILPDPLYRWRLRSGAISADRSVEQLIFSVLAKTFASERRIFGADSYSDMRTEHRDDYQKMAVFLREYRLRRRFHYSISKALAGSKAGRSAIARLGMEPALANLFSVPKAGLGMLRNFLNRAPAC